MAAEARVGAPVQVRVFDSPFRAGIDPLKLIQLIDDLAVDEAVAPVPDR